MHIRQHKNATSDTDIVVFSLLSLSRGISMRGRWRNGRETSAKHEKGLRGAILRGLGRSSFQILSWSRFAVVVIIVNAFLGCPSRFPFLFSRSCDRHARSDWITPCPPWNCCDAEAFSTPDLRFSWRCAKEKSSGVEIDAEVELFTFSARTEQF